MIYEDEKEFKAFIKTIKYIKNKFSEKALYPDFDGQKMIIKKENVKIIGIYDSNLVLNIKRYCFI